MTADPDALVAFALDALARTPEARIEDVYKWLFQATCGAEHAVASDEQARASLEREWETLGRPRFNEPLVEPLRPDGLIVRVNLRPCRAHGVSPDEVLRALLASADRAQNKSSAFTDVWRELGVRLSEREHGHLSRDHWQRLDVGMRATGYGPMHHSASFRAAYDPAYRVLRGVEARTLAQYR